MVKITGLPADTSPSTDDITITVDTTSGQAKKVSLSDLLGTGLIPLAGLSSTAFSSQVTTYANPGTAGGTFYYLNLGGIRLFWGKTANNIGSAAPTTYTVTLPVGYFTTIQTALLTIGPNNTTNDQKITFGGGGVTTTTLGINILAASTTTAEPVNVFVIGT